MKFVTLDRLPAGRAGVIIGAEVLDLGLAASVFPLSRWIPPSLTRIIEAGEDGMELIRKLVRAVEEASPAQLDDLRAEGALVPLANAKLLAPIPRPGILLSHGRAYHSHVAEMRGAGTAEPVGFMKNVNAVIGAGAPIVAPASAPDQLDFEAEISIVFGKDCHGVTAEEAMDYVFGFTIVNDVSARNWVPDLKEKPDLNRMGKQFETFAPVGPCIATPDELGDVSNIHLVTRLNGEVMQDAWTKDLIWSIPELIAYYARWYPFKAGDIMTTGTPEGVGYGRQPKVFMKPGDVVSITVDGVGELANPIVAAR